MFKLIVLALVSSEYVASSVLSNETTINRQIRQSSSCGVPYREGTGLIIGGQNIERGSWPWMVALLGKSSGKFFCGGTLISKTKVVTAAHCVLEKFTTKKKIARDVLQVFGAHDISSIYQAGTFTQSPWKIIIHDDWHPDTINFDADISLLLNEEEIPTTRLIRPICLWSSSNDPVVVEGLVTGWGIESNGKYSTTPKQIKVPIHQNDDCLYGNSLLAQLKTKRTLCAGARDGTGPCLGDSGSGMVFDKNEIFYLRAIVSSAILNSNQTCDLSNYAVYTDVFKYLKWIDEIKNSNFLIQQPAPVSQIPAPAAVTQVPPYDTNSDVFMTRPTKAAKRTRPTTKIRPSFDPMFKKPLAYDAELSSSIEQFSLQLMYTTNDDFEQENFMISPFSVYHLLVLIAEGANGNTLKELNDQLKMITIERTRNFQQYLNIKIANVILNKFAIMVTDRARPVDPEFETRIEKFYEADVMPVFFSDVDNTLNSINRAVNHYTQGQITDTVKREDLLKAQLILISGLFFKGNWMNGFNTAFTKQEPFFDNNGVKTGNVNMMIQRGLFAYAGVADLGCHIIELPYAELSASRNGVNGTGLSFILVLPRKGLPLEEAINNIYLHGMKKIYFELYNAKVENEDEEVEVHVPRFEIETTLSMNTILQSMDIKDIFDQSRADLSNINKQYFVSSMIHKTKMSVDEKGMPSVAGSVDTSIFANRALPKFHANKPFLFFIIDKATDLILSSGQYVKPELY